MIKKILFVTYFLSFLLSCMHKEKHIPTLEDNKKNTIAIEIISTDKDVFDSLEKEEENDKKNYDIVIDKFGEETFNKLIELNIDPLKVYELDEKARKGNEEAILTLSDIFYKLNDNVRVEKYLKYGIDKNIEEAIYNMGILKIQNREIDEGITLFKKLSEKKYGIKNKLLYFAYTEYTEGNNYLKENNKKKAIEYYINAYKLGFLDLDIEIANLYSDNINKIKWLKKAEKRNVDRAILELALLYNKIGEEKKSRDKFKKLFDLGHKEFALPIAVSYHKEDNYKEAIKWYKISADNGDRESMITLREFQKYFKEHPEDKIRYLNISLSTEIIDEEKTYNTEIVDDENLLK